MQLRDLFAKPVDRPIEGVIKADDQRDLRLEMEEYILTAEAEARLETFLEAYNESRIVNGAWISGFFGSGKSHLLKMLALLLENRQLSGEASLDLFLPKCGDNALLAAALKKACARPARSILFNIDQKASNISSKAQADALLQPFVRVFNEMRGFYGQQGYIAEFERSLEANGLYARFQEEFARLAGIPWQEGRVDAIFQAASIDKAYCLATGRPESAEKGILDKYRADYAVSIDDFADSVRAWLDQQGPDYRINFFVDEVGQYIDKNSKLMLNLQTIAESLATRCDGRAWVIVTSQEDLESITGEMDKGGKNDFSKIQARFEIRASLTSQNVDEVIEKRLLAKTEPATARLGALYDAISGNLRTLLEFGDGSRTYRNFRDQEHFISSWPFPPYQFQLFQDALRGLSNHNVFEGRHTSVGERSMLSIFQKAAIRLADREPERLVPFDLLFDGLAGAIKSQARASILQAEKQLGDPFALRLLKALFLVKYVPEFHATRRNIGILLLERLDQDLITLDDKVRNALNLLDRQMYIQRNEDLYEFLTNEERDIEEEIRNTDVDPGDLLKAFSELIFDRILGNTKIRHSNGKDFKFTRKLDDQAFRSEQEEVAINVITPLNDNAGKADILQLQNTGRNELMIALEPDNELVEELRLYKQTEKYLSQPFANQNSQTAHLIREHKRDFNRARLELVLNRLGDAITQARFFTGLKEIETGGSPKNRIESAFRQLLDSVYVNLPMLRNVEYTENDIEKFLRAGDQLEAVEDLLSEAETALYNKINEAQRKGERMSLKLLKDIFERRPYGWYHAAIMCGVAKLLAAGKIELIQNGAPLEGKHVLEALRKGPYQNVDILPQEQFTPAQTRRLRRLFEDLFDKGGPPEARELISATRENLAAMLREVRRLLSQKAQYPFLIRLEKVATLLESCQNMAPAWYMNEFFEHEERLLRYKEKLLSPVTVFMNGTQKEIFNAASQFRAIYSDDLRQLDQGRAQRLEEILASDDSFQANRMPEARSLLHSLKQEHQDKFEAALGQARERLEQRKSQLAAMPEFLQISSDQQQELTGAIEAVARSLGEQTTLAGLENLANDFENRGFASLADKLYQLASHAVQEGDQTRLIVAAKNREQTVTPLASLLPRLLDTPFLASEADIDNWLAQVRQKLLAEINQGKKVQI